MERMSDERPLREIIGDAAADCDAVSISGDVYLLGDAIAKALALRADLAAAKKVESKPSDQTRELREIATRYEAVGDAPIAVVAMRLAAGTIDRQEASLTAAQARVKELESALTNQGHDT